MNKEIEIKGFINKSRISIIDNKVSVVKKSIFKYLEYDISLETVHHSKTVKTEMNRDLIFLALMIFFIGGLINMVGGEGIFGYLSGISFIVLVAGLLTKNRTITINTDSNLPLVLRFKKGNEVKIREFADLLIIESKSYIIKKYSKVDKDLPSENQLINIEYLRNNELINDSKFEELKNIILNKKETKKSIGFE